MNAIREPSDPMVDYKILGITDNVNWIIVVINQFNSEYNILDQNQIWCS